MVDTKNTEAEVVKNVLHISTQKTNPHFIINIIEDEYLSSVFNVCGSLLLLLYDRFVKLLVGARATHALSALVP